MTIKSSTSAPIKKSAESAEVFVDASLVDAAPQSTTIQQFIEEFVEQLEALAETVKGFLQQDNDAGVTVISNKKNAFRELQQRLSIDYGLAKRRWDIGM